MGLQESDRTEQPTQFHFKLSEKERNSHSVGHMFSPSAFYDPLGAEAEFELGMGGEVSIWVGWLLLKTQTHVC